MWSYKHLHCFFPGGKNTFSGPLPTEGFGKVLVNSRAPDPSSNVSVMVLVLAIKNSRGRPWPNGQDVKECILAEQGGLGNPPKGLDYYPGPKFSSARPVKKRDAM